MVAWFAWFAWFACNQLTMLGRRSGTVPVLGLGPGDGQMVQLGDEWGSMGDRNDVTAWVIAKMCEVPAHHRARTFWNVTSSQWQ